MSTLKRGHRLVTWGCNISGALGRDEVRATAFDVPGVVPTPPDDGPIQVSAGWGHTAFVTHTGKTVLFGRAIDMRNTLRFGKLAKSKPGFADIWTKYLGGAGSIDFPDPTIVSGDLHCKKVSSSAGLTLGITDEGTAFAVGANRYGQAGVEDVTDDRPLFAAAPVKLPSSAGRLLDISAGHQNACAVDEFGDVYAWGKGDRGQTGYGEDGVKQSPTRLPIKLPRVDYDGIISVSCGFFHCIALARSGKVYVWGKLQAEGGTQDAPSPIAVPNLPPIAEAVCGQYHCVVRDFEGNIFQWGLRPYELGAGFISEPQRIQGIPKSAKSISCGVTESAVLDAGVPYIWDWKDMRARQMKELDKFNVKQLSLGWRHRAALVE